MPPLLSKVDYERLEKKSPVKQREYFEDYRSEFTRERVSIAKKNVQLSDHLAVERSIGYTHHFICSGIQPDGKILIIEFSFRPVPSDAGLAIGDLGVFGTVKESVKTYEELEKEEVYIIKWPKSLIRYGVQEIVQRAKSRIGDTYYSLLENNCEHLVSWCICGLNVSRQLSEWYSFIVEGTFAIGSSAKEVVSQKTAVKVFANISDELVTMFNIEPSSLGFILGTVLESGIAAYECRKAYKKWNDGSYSDEQFHVKMVEILSKGICRFSFGALGSVLGTSGGPVGSLAGGAIGAAIGHLVGFLLSWCYKNRDCLDG